MAAANCLQFKQKFSIKLSIYISGCVYKKNKYMYTYTHTVYISIQGQLPDNSSRALDTAADRSKATKRYNQLVNL